MHKMHAEIHSFYFPFAIQRDICSAHRHLISSFKLTSFLSGSFRCRVSCQLWCYNSITKIGSRINLFVLIHSHFTSKNPFLILTAPVCHELNEKNLLHLYEFPPCHSSIFVYFLDFSLSLCLSFVYSILYYLYWQQNWVESIGKSIPAFEIYHSQLLSIHSHFHIWRTQKNILCLQKIR